MHNVHNKTNFPIDPVTENIASFSTNNNAIRESTILKSLVYSSIVANKTPYEVRSSKFPRKTI